MEEPIARQRQQQQQQQQQQQPQHQRYSLKGHEPIDAFAIGFEGLASFSDDNDSDFNVMESFPMNEYDPLPGSDSFWDSCRADPHEPDTTPTFPKDDDWKATTPIKPGPLMLAPKKVSTMPRSSSNKSDKTVPFDWGIIKDPIRRRKIERWKRKRDRTRMGLTTKHVYDVRVQHAIKRPRTGGRFISAAKANAISTGTTA